MKSKKQKALKWPVASLCIVLILVLVFSGFCAYRRIRVQNVFDEMWCAHYRSFATSTQIPVGKFEWGGRTPLYRYVDENHLSGFAFVDGKIIFTYALAVEGRNADTSATRKVCSLTYQYDAGGRTLQPVRVQYILYEGSAKYEYLIQGQEALNILQDSHEIDEATLLQWQQDGLAEVLQYWFENNRNATRFSMEDWGRYTLLPPSYNI